MIYLQVVESIFEHLASLLLAILGIVAWYFISEENIRNRNFLGQGKLEGPVKGKPAFVDRIFAHERPPESGCIARYMAMFGSVPEVSQQQREQDIVLYGKTHVGVRKGKQIAPPIKVVRFMVEVCNLYAHRAEECAKSIVKERGDYVIDAFATHGSVAKALVDESDSILDALYTAEFLSGTWEYSSKDAEFWRSVAHEIRFFNPQVEKDVSGGEQVS